MHRFIVLLAAGTLVVLAGCTSTPAPTTATKLEPKIRSQVQKGIIEPGFTPEMVYLALGKPNEPADSLVDATTNGTWVYLDFSGKPDAIVRAGFRRRVVYDPAHKGEVIVTEPLDPKAYPNLRANSLQVTFKDGRVVDIQRLAAL